MRDLGALKVCSWGWSGMALALGALSEVSCTYELECSAQRAYDVCKELGICMAHTLPPYTRVREGKNLVFALDIVCSHM
jgi:hypothetical protein